MSFDETTPGKGDRRVIRGVVGILSGSALAQLLALAGIPVLAHLYSPDDTARYALLLGVSTVIASFASLRLELAIPLPSGVLDSQRIFWLAVALPLVVLPIMGVVMAVLVGTGLWRPSGLGLLDALLVVAFVIVLCFLQAASQLAIRVRTYGVLSRLPILQMCGMLTAQISLGALGFDRGLFMGGLLGRSLGSVGLARSCDLRLKQAPGKSQALQLMREYWRFPIILAPAALVEVLGSNIAALMLPALYGYAAAGLFAMAVRVSSLPGAIISHSAGQVFLGEFSRAETQEDSMRIFLRFSAALACAGAAVAATIWVLAPILLPLVLNETWSGTAHLAQYTGVMAGAAMLGSPVQHVWTVRQHAFMQFSWSVLRLVSTAATLWIAAGRGPSIAEAAAAVAVTTLVTYVLAWLGCLYSVVCRPPA